MIAHRAGPVVANEDADAKIRRIADKPEILGLVGGARLAGEMLADRLDRDAGAALNHAFHDRSDLVGRQRVDHLLALVDQLGFVLIVPFGRVAAETLPVVVTVDGMTPTVLHAIDQRLLDPFAAIGEHRIGGHHAHQRGFAGAQRHREIGRHVVVDAETLGEFSDDGHADILGEPHRHHIFRVLDSIAQRMRATAVAAFEIFRGPHGSVGLHDGDRLVENLRGRRVAAVERGRVDKGLERGARLTQCLRRPVELGLVEGKAPDHRENAPGIGVHRHHGAGNFGDLPQAVLSGAALHGFDIDDIAGRERAAHAAAGPAHAVDRQNAGLAFARHLAGFFARRLQTDASLRLAGVEHHRQPPRFYVAERRNRRQLRSPVGRNVDMIHGPAKAVRLVEAHQAIRQRLPRQRLNLWIERCSDGQTAFVELFFAVKIKQFTPNLLGEIARHVSVWREHARVDAKRLRLGLGSIRGRNESVGYQSVDHVISPLDGAITVQERVIVVRPFRQGGEIGRLGDGQLVDRFVEIIERGGADAVISEA